MNVIDMDEIPDDLVINWDQNEIHYVPVSSWMMEKEAKELRLWHQMTNGN